MQSPAIRPGGTTTTRQNACISVQNRTIQTRSSHIRDRWIHPRFRRMQPPVIVVGMHRSGTSLVAGLLSRLGVYMGPKVQLPREGGPIEDQTLIRSGYAEAEEFVYLNDSLLTAAGASWDEVDPFLALREDPTFMNHCAVRLQRATAGSLYWDYLRSMPNGYRGSWGWKDPRNTLTLPCWLSLFPDARVIHVRRNPAAVVTSLQRRAQDPVLTQGEPLPPGERLRWWLRNPGQTVQRLGRKLGLIPRNPGRPNPCVDRSYCERLSETYENAFLTGIGSLQSCLELHYEEILAHPVDSVRELREFLGSDCSDDQLRRAADLVATREQSGIPLYALSSR